MKTYEETIESISNKIWNNQMDGGQGRIEPGMIPFIFDKQEDVVYRDIELGIEDCNDKYKRER